MFQPDPAITNLNVRERNIAKVLFSMNIPQVATPELSVEDAKCYIFFFREGNRLSAFIALYLPRTDRRFYYSCSSNPFPEEAMAEVEDEARRFVEDMGFLLDEIYFSGMSLDEKNRWIEIQEIFSGEESARPLPAARAQGPAQTAAKQSRTDDVFAHAVKAGVIKQAAPSRQSLGVVAREKEGLARLFASF